MSAPMAFAQRYRTIVAAKSTVASCGIAMPITVSPVYVLLLVGIGLADGKLVQERAYG